MVTWPWTNLSNFITQIGLYCSEQLETTFHQFCEKLLHITFMTELLTASVKSGTSDRHAGTITSGWTAHSAAGCWSRHVSFFSWLWTALLQCKTGLSFKFSVPAVYLPAESLPCSCCSLSSGCANYCIFIRLHCSTVCVHAAYCNRPSIVVCRSVCYSSEQCKNGWTKRDAVWVMGSDRLKEPLIRSGSISPWEGTIFRGKGAAHCTA